MNAVPPRGSTPDLRTSHQPANHFYPDESRQRTSHETDSVYLEILHGQLPEGLNYIKEMNLELTTREIRLKVENFNYNRS